MDQYQFATITSQSYEQRGRFHLDNIGNGAFLVTPAGHKIYLATDEHFQLTEEECIQFNGVEVVARLNSISFDHVDGDIISVALLSTLNSIN